MEEVLRAARVLGALDGDDVRHTVDDPAGTAEDVVDDGGAGGLCRAGRVEAGEAEGHGHGGSFQMGVRESSVI